MPALKNLQREKFAENLVAGMSPEAAYAAAGYRPHRQNAHRMMTDDDVRARIEELRAPAVDAVRWDYQARLAMLRDIAFAAREAGDHRTVIAAIAEANRMENVCRAGPKDRAAGDVEAAFAAFIREIVEARPALPIGSAGALRERRASSRPDA